MLIFTTALFSCVVLILALKSCSSKIGLVDHPGGRKQHSSPTPTIGGLAMFISVAVVTYFFDAHNEQTNL
jgi:UDP-GlcNAc:undecaprenyl-phosphate GlcNAc-1-phosphate transferase